MKSLMLHAGYTQIGLGFGLRHDIWGWPWPPGPPVKYAPGFFEGPAPMGWHPGIPFSHKKAKTIKADGGPAIQHGHDAGYLIPHLPFLTSPPNAMLLIHMLLSKHKVMFPVGRVIIENKPVGTYLQRHYLGMICSNPISMPTGVLVPFQGTVNVGMDLKDIVMGFVFIFVDMIIDAIWSKIMKGDTWRKVNARNQNWIKPGAAGSPSFLQRMAVFPGRPSGRNYLPSKALPAFNKAMNAAGVTTDFLHKYLVVPRLFKTQVLERIYKREMEQRTWGHFARLGLQKAADHFGKSWIFSPLAAGTLFQSTTSLHGWDRNHVPSIAVGRSGLHFKFFPKPTGWRGNVVN